MTPSFSGRMATMLPGVLPSISFAVSPTARPSRRTLFVPFLTATTLGSLRTMPFPCTHTSVLAVPRSIPMSIENLPRIHSRRLAMDPSGASGPARSIPIHADVPGPPLYRWGHVEHRTTTGRAFPAGRSGGLQEAKEGRDRKRPAQLPRATATFRRSARGAVGVSPSSRVHLPRGAVPFDLVHRAAEQRCARNDAQ